MNNWILKENNIEVGVTEECGHLDPVKFIFDDKIYQPMHIAPWINEKNLDPSLPPMLKTLRNDFFCAPFGDSDIIKCETRPHGASANDKWVKINDDKNFLELQLSKKIMGANLKKRISIKEDHPVVYQQHIFEGGEGKIPVGHHSMLHVPEKVYLSFSNWIYGAAPPSPIEPDPEKGWSILKYPQTFNDLKSVKLFDGREADFSRYPNFDSHEDLLMLISDDELPFAWSAVSAPENGWLWFSIKSPRVLKNTVLWLSNGGRKYSPFLSRHKNVIGVEEVTSYFHLGHKASIEKNELNEKGFKTFIELNPDKNFSTKFGFGLVKIPKKFKRVKNIEPHKDGIKIIDENGISVFTKFDLKFITENDKEN